MNTDELLQPISDVAPSGEDLSFSAEFDQIAAAKLSPASQNFVNLARLVARGALWREESRGGHYREDFPDKRKEFGNINISIVKGRQGEMDVRPVPKLALRDDLQRIVEEMG